MSMHFRLTVFIIVVCSCEMLENGTWPSYDEIGILIEKGFDYYKELEENS